MTNIAPRAPITLTEMSRANFFIITKSEVPFDPLTNALFNSYEINKNDLDVYGSTLPWFQNRFKSPLMKYVGDVTDNCISALYNTGIQNVPNINKSQLNMYVASIYAKLSDMDWTAPYFEDELQVVRDETKLMEDKIKTIDWTKQVVWGSMEQN